MSAPRNPFAPGPEDADRTMIGMPNFGNAPPGGFGGQGQGQGQDEGDRTMIGAPPPPGGGQGAAQGGGFTPAKLSLDSLPSVGPNPLTAAGSPLITLANSLRAVTRYDDLGRLRSTVVEELRRFQSQARGRGSTEEEVRYGHYALCALLDETILFTPWGAKSAWAAQTLVATFHNEVVSGDRMFEVADALETRPARAPNLLELIYVCLSFGFEGRLRLERNGANQLLQMRERIYQALRNLRGPFERALSPHWRGVEAAYQPIARRAPLWVWLAGLGVLALAIYAAFVLALSGLADGALKPLARAYQAGPAQLNRTAPPPADDSRLYTTILDILKPDIDAGRVGVTDGADAVVVRLKDKGLFASGSADLDSAYDGTMGRIVQALALTTGDAPVTGHTDDRRIASLRFPSNQALSEARAQTVAAKLAADGADTARLHASGAGETEPVASNADEAGRRQNRRVEVAIPKTYADHRPPAR